MVRTCAIIFQRLLYLLRFPLIADLCLFQEKRSYFLLILHVFGFNLRHSLLNIKINGTQCYLLDLFLHDNTSYINLTHIGM